MSLARSGTLADMRDASSSSSSSSRPRIPSGGRSYIPLSVSTRSMSRRDLASTLSSTTPLTTPYASSSLGNSKLMSSRGLSSSVYGRPPTATWRQPLHETTLNEARKPGGKRKSDEMERDGMRKTVRLERGEEYEGDRSVYPKTPGRSELSTPPKRPLEEPKPTPARHILRFGKLIPVDDDDDEGEEAMEGIVARPPTPPRAHDRSSATGGDSVPLRPITPGRPIPPISTPAPAVQVTASTTPTFTPPPKAFPPVTPDRKSFLGMSRLAHSPLPPQPAPSQTRVEAPKAQVMKLAAPKLEEKQAMPPVRTALPTPQRLGGFGGMSRLGVAPSPASKSFLPSPFRPPPAPVSTAQPAPRALVQSTLTSSTTLAKPKPMPPPPAPGPAPAPARGMTRSTSRLPTSTAALTRSSSKMPLSRSGSLASLANMSNKIAEPELPRVAEDVEVDIAEEKSVGDVSVATIKADTTMLPPSKIPIKSSRAMQPFPRPSMSRAESSFSLDKPAAPEVVRSEVKKPSVGSALPERRPTSRPTMTSTMPPPRSLPPSTSLASLSKMSEVPENTSSTIKRKPSYPSSLGHGPPRQPTPRMVSVPVPAHVIDRTTPADTEMEIDEPFLPAAKGRSVSMPEGAKRLSLSLSTRREGWTDTSKNLAGLSDALEKLKVKKELSCSVSRPNLSASTTRTSLPSTSQVLQDATSTINLPSERLAAVHKPRPGSAASNYADVSMESGDRSLAALMCSSNGGGCLKGVVAFVDVWTADGTDSGGVFVDMLKGLGARVLTRPTESCTHIVYKSGRPSTLTWYRKQEDPPHIVGISWVTKSKEAGKRLAEDGFCVNVAEEDIFQKRRKTMEPKSLNMTSSVGYGRPPSSLGASIIEARRKSLVHAPKISSPLKKDYRTVSELH